MRRKSFSYMASLLLLLAFGSLLLLYPQESAEAARDGLRICFELLIPSLFPFFVLSSLLVSLGFATLLGRCLKHFMWPMFRLNAPCATALVLGAVGGYPVGARITAQLYEDRLCSRADALRLSAFSNNCGPAFLFSVAGWGIFSSKAAGFLLLGTHLAAALVVGLLFRYYPLSEEGRTVLPPPAQKNSFATVFPDCVRDSFSSTLNVCAFVVLFSVILRLSSCSGLLPWIATQLSLLLPTSFPPALCQSLIAGIFELSIAICSLSDISALPAALPLAAFLLGWGGLSVHCQALPFLNRCVDSFRPYFLGKFLQGIVAASLTAFLAPLLLPASTPTMLPLEGIFFHFPAIQLLHHEFLALWLLSGVYFLLSQKKGLVKPLHLHYNKKEK